MTEHLQRGLLLFDQRRYDLAERELRAALATDPDHPLAHAVLAFCLLERDDLDGAEAEAGQAILNAPDESFSHHAMSRVLHQRRRTKEAEEAIREAIRLSPDDAGYHASLAGILMDLRRWPDALAAAERGLEIDAEHDGCANLRVLALRQLGRADEAAAAMEGVLARRPDDAVSHANQGWALLERGDADKALEHFREALRIDPELDWARAGLVEALKARYRIYGWMLRYFLWMAKLAAKAQWGLIIGAYIGYRILLSVAQNNPGLAPFVTPILILYVAFVFLSWTAVPLFNLTLRLNRFGRHALTADQRMGSNFVGLAVLIAIACLISWAITQHSLLLLATVYSAVLILPIAGTFSCDPGWPRWVMATVTALLILTGLAEVALLGIGFFLDEGGQALLLLVAKPLQPVFLIGVLGSQFLANALSSVTPTR